MAVGFLRTTSHRMCRMKHRENVSETLVEFSSLHLHCGAQPHRPAADQSPHSHPAPVTKGSHFVAPRRCPMAPAATKAWRGQPLRAGRA